MGTLQETTKPFLLPLLTRERDIIQSHERKILAAWTTVFAFVYASSAPDHTTQNASQRRTFMSDKAPPPYWIYWCAPFDGRSSPAFHFGIAQSKNIGPMISKNGVSDAPAVHLTFCGAGGICFAIFGANSQSSFQAFSQLVTMGIAQAGFVQFWPTVESIVRLSAGRSSAFSALDLLAVRGAVMNAMSHVRR
jgi:hypothetical protein